MSDKPRDAISVYISANSPEGARALFDASMEMVATGDRFSGQLVWAGEGDGAAQLFTHDRRLPSVDDLAAERRKETSA